MTTCETKSVFSLAEICGYSIDRVLVDGSSFLASGPGGRTIVLKKIDADCILGHTLHPHVRDRLSKVRELAHPNVANLLGVDREGEEAYVIWEFIEGIAFDVYAGANRSPREIASAARELAMALDLLHMQGIVHGALIGNNVIVSPTGTVRLTHISPLLYTDPSVDIECLWNLLEQAAGLLNERGKTLATLLSEARERNVTLRQLATLLVTLIDPREIKKIAEVEIDDGAPRRRAIAGAALAAAAGLGLAWGAWHAVETGRLGHAESARSPFHTLADR